MIELHQSEHHTLSIRLSPDGFSFSIYNPLHDTSLSVIDKDIDSSLSLTANLKKAFQEYDFLGYPYKQVNVIVVNKRIVTMPLELFEDEQTELIFYHNHTPKENESVQYNILKKSSIVVLFGMDKSAFNFIREQYPAAYFYAQTSALIEYFSVKNKLGNNRKMYLFSQPQGIALYCFEKGHLVFANSFDCKYLEDRIYHLLYVWKLLNFDQERDELHLAGTLSDKEQFTEGVRRYILNLFVMDPTTNIDMQAILLCE
jgi:hypothetical protein